MGRGTLQTGRVGRSVKQGVFNPVGSLQSGRVRPATALAPADYFATVQSTLGAANIVAHYRLDETSGTTAADATGNGYDGMYTNGPTLGATSLLTSGGGTAVDFDGVNDYVDFGVEPDFDFIHQSGVFTVAAWVEFNATSAFGMIVGNAFSNTQDGFYLRCDNVNRLGAGINGAGTFRSETTSVLTAGTYFFAATGDGTDLRIYLDGSSVGTPVAMSAGGSPAPNETAIGVRRTANDFAYEGRIDEVTIANVTATPAQIAALYAAGT